MKSKKSPKPEPLELKGINLDCNNCLCKFEKGTDSFFQGSGSIVGYTNGRLNYNKLILWKCKVCGDVCITGSDFVLQDTESGILGCDPCFNMADLTKLIKGELLC